MNKKALLGLSSITLLGGIVATNITQALNTRNHDYQEGLMAYRQAECQKSIDYFDRFTNNWSIFNKFDRRSSIVNKYQQECQNFQFVRQTSRKTLAKGNVDEAFLAYINFAAKHNSSALMPSIQDASTQLLSRYPVTSFTNTCHKLDLAFTNELIPNENLYAQMSWQCGKIAYQKGECQEALGHLSNVNFLADTDEQKQIKQECQSFVKLGKKIDRAISSQSYEQVLLLNYQFLNTHDRSPLAKHVVNKNHHIINQHELASFATKDVCDIIPELSHRQLFPDSAQTLPKLHWYCSEMFYKQYDCDSSLNHIALSLTQAKKQHSYVNQAKGYQEECQAMIVTKDITNEVLNDKQYDKAMLVQADFITKFPQSDLVNYIVQQGRSIFANSGADKISSPNLCKDIKRMIDFGLIPNPDKNVPMLNWRCGDKAYQRAECKSAISHLNTIIGLSNFDRAKQIKDECNYYLQILAESKNFKQGNYLDKTLIPLVNFVQKYDNGPLAKKIRQESTNLFAQHGSAKLTGYASCQHRENIRKHTLIPNPNSNAPLFYWHCGQFYASEQQENDELNTYIQFITHYHNHSLASQVKKEFLAKPVICSRMDEYQKNKALANTPNFMPAIYMVCARAYLDVVDFPKAITSLNKLAHNYQSESWQKSANLSLESVEQEVDNLKSNINIAINKFQLMVIGCTAGGMIAEPFMDLIETISGKDCITGDKLHEDWRIRALINFTPGLEAHKKIKQIKKIIKVAEAYEQYSSSQAQKDLLSDTQQLSIFLKEKREEIIFLSRYNNDLTPIIKKMDRPLTINKKLASNFF